MCVSPRVLGAVLVTLGALSAASSLTSVHPAIPTVLGVATAVVGAVQIGFRSYAQSQAVPVGDVVEVRAGGQVIAGPANGLAGEGEYVRTIGG